ncbi:cytochrome P450 [Actinomycetospora sp. NBRC 106378]|uniref:cytochrome P450 n=1 Tax=Actinomycetospora sp. NBRC 106378 TaxID=3032208 RepID=UPI0024A11D51|nr:cytochrome P450 [Actinomycetospora sp. NBRC 106378]GLZ53775.1 cytochrome P450 [Actinomycetospora sp. NBRC 106378]
MSVDASELPLHVQRDQFDPPAEISALRDRPGLERVHDSLGREAWLVTRYDDAREVLGDATRFSNQRVPAVPMPGVDPEKMRAGQLLALDPPDHTRLRRLLTGEFTVRRIRRLQPRVQEIVDEHLDAMATAGPPADLVTDFALPIPSLVICELLGVPYDDRDDFQTRASKQIDLTLPMAERGKVALESREYMGGLVDRAVASPGDDLLGMLVREHGDDVTRDELIGIASLLLIAGHETTANMLALGTLALLRHPDQAALLRADPDAVAPAVEELMRFLSIVHAAVPRVAVDDTEVGGEQIAAGDMVLVQLAAADRDRALADDPDQLDIGRAAAPHVAFGHGVHHCLGAPLARMEMATAFPALLRRFPTLAPVNDVARADFREGTFIYGMRSLPLTW